MALQSSQRLPELLFYTKKSYRILQAPIPAPIPAPILHVHTTLQSREFSIQNPILHAEDKELFEYCYYIQRAKRPSFQKRNSMHRRQGDLLEIHPCVLQDIPGNSSCSNDIPVIPDLPETFQTFQSFMTFQPFQAILQILQCSSISRESTPFQHSPIRMHILQFDWFPQKLHRVPVEQLQTLQTLHSSKKGRCCDIGQIDIFSRIELFPLSSCQVIILIARMTFNCSTSCLMS